MLSAGFRGFALVAALAGFPGAVNAATYHVNPQGGSDANPGTASAPWRTPPGTRNTGNSGFLNGAWGSISPSNKVGCGDVILLRGGTTQTSAQGGAWLIDETYYRSCTAASPTTIKVATAAEWSGSSGDFTIDGSGISATYHVLNGSGNQSLVNVARINNIHIRGASASQRIKIRDAGGSPSAHGFAAQHYNASMSGIWLDYAEISNSSEIGVSLGRVTDSKFSNVISHDNASAGFGTGMLNDQWVERTGFVDIESYNNGPTGSTGTQDDGINFVGPIDVWCVRCTTHDNNQRGYSSGVINDSAGVTTRTMMRDFVTYDNGFPCNYTGLYCSGAGAKPSGAIVQVGSTESRTTIVGSEAFHNGDFAFGAYGNAKIEIWHASVYNSNADTNGSGGAGDSADFHWNDDGNQIYVMNTAHLATGGGGDWADVGVSSPVSTGNPNLTPIMKNDCWRHQSATSEKLGIDWVGAAGTYASPDTDVYDTTNQIGAGGGGYPACNLNWTATNLTDYSQNDFTPKAGSSLMDAGRFLMLANGSGTNAITITVKANGGSSDPRNFFIQPDSYLNPALADRKIEIEGCGERYVNDMTPTTITLDAACSWANGAGIHLPWSGTRPDIGAVETASGPPPPGPPPPPVLLPIE